MKDHTESKEITWNVCMIAQFPRRDPDGLSYLTLSQAWVSNNQNVGIPSDRNTVLKKRKKCCFFSSSSWFKHTHIHTLSLSHTYTHQSTSYITKTKHTHTHKITTETILLPKPLPPLTAKKDLFLFCSLFHGLPSYSQISLKYRNQTNSSNANTITKKPNSTNKKSCSFGEANENRRT